MIRDKIFQEITETIQDHQRFEPADFDIEGKGEARSLSATLTIKYKFETKYKVEIKFPEKLSTFKTDFGKEEDYEFTGTICPGPIAYKERVILTGKDKLFRLIRTWLENVWEELSANPILREVNEQKIELEKLFENIKSFDDKYVNKSEAEELKSRLDDLEEKFKAKFEAEIKNASLQKEKVAELEKDIETLKKLVHSLSKGNWFKSLLSKSYKWIRNEDNRELLKDGYTTVREFLPDDIKNALPTGE